MANENYIKGIVKDLLKPAYIASGAEWTSEEELKLDKLVEGLKYLAIHSVREHLTATNDAAGN